MNRISIPAVALSSVIVLAMDIIGSTVLFALNSPEISPNITPAQIEAITLAMSQDLGFMFSALLYGTATTIIGGYLAARFAKKYPYFNAAAFGLTSIVLGLLLSSETPFWFQALGLLSTIPAAVLGGHWYCTKNV
ncbi:MAG: hypothetical protein V4805_07290 [Pseudomonadota bacterium]